MTVAPRGFTLIETLVVLVIVGLLASVTLLSWTSGSNLREDAVALAARATLAAQESVISGAAMGLDVTPVGYAFYRIEAGVWREVDDERAFRRQAWREGVVSSLRRDGFGATDRRASKQVTAPTLVFDPIGLMPSFSVTLSEGKEQLVVVGNAQGSVEVSAARHE